MIYNLIFSPLNNFIYFTHMKRFLPVVCVLSCTLLSCLGGKKTVKEHKTVMLDSVVVSANDKKFIYREAAPKIWEITNNKVALYFNLKEKTAEGNVWIDMHPYFYATDSLTLDAKGMKIYSVTLVDYDTHTPVLYTYTNDEIKIKFEKQYHSNEKIKLLIHYLAMPYANSTGGSAAISDDRGLYFINTDNSIPGKPVQIWTQGETEANSHWLPTIDKPNTRFTTEIALTVPDSFETLSNGYLAERSKPKDGLRTDTWKMDMPIQAYVAMFAIGKFSIVKDQWRGKDVNYYVEPAFEKYARKMFEHTPEMIEHFSNITGVPYPWNKYDQVVVRDYVSGAMENTSATLHGEFLNQNFRELADKNNEDVVSHELFHQWFGDYVTCESWSNLTVNESFADYGEQLWRRYKYGDEKADVLAYEDLHIYLQSAKYSDPTLVRFYYADKEQMFDRTTYQKGGAILHCLNQMIGDSAFYKAMQIYLTKNALHSAEATNWRLAVEEATGQDWNWYFNQWYYHEGHPVLDITYTYDDDSKQLIVKAKQEDSAYTYRLPLKVAIIYGNVKTIVDWDLQKREETFFYDYKNGVKPVIVPDVTHRLVGELNEEKTPAQRLIQYKACNDYVNRIQAVGSSYKKFSDSCSQEIMGLALADKMGSVRAFALQKLRTQKNKKWKDKWLPAVIEIAKTDENRNARYEAISILGDWNITDAKPFISKAVFDSSYMVSGGALTVLYKLDPDTAHLLAARIVNMDPKATLYTSAWQIIGAKAHDDDVVLFENELSKLHSGNAQFGLAGSLFTYALNVNNDISFGKAVNMFVRFAEEQDVKAYRSGMESYVIQLYKSYKGKTELAKGDNKVHLQQRTDLIKDSIDKMIATEKDPENVKTMKEIMKG